MLRKKFLRLFRTLALDKDLEGDISRIEINENVHGHVIEFYNACFLKQATHLISVHLFRVGKQTLENHPQTGLRLNLALAEQALKYLFTSDGSLVPKLSFDHGEVSRRKIGDAHQLGWRLHSEEYTICVPQAFTMKRLQINLVVKTPKHRRIQPR